MVASPNGFAGVYDEPGAPPDAATVRDLLTPAVARSGGTAVSIPEGGSDDVPFANAGITVGGVFSGASDPVTQEQAVTSGSTAGRPADPCYHLACDDGSDLDLGLARTLTAALADVAGQLANDPTLLPR
jgi:Zn-dependent M28 family amino/carboxypeptidase